jgi:hypothetical protein
MYSSSGPAEPGAPSRTLSASGDLTAVITGAISSASGSEADNIADRLLAVTAGDVEAADVISRTVAVGVSDAEAVADTSGVVGTSGVEDAAASPDADPATAVLSATPSATVAAADDAVDAAEAADTGARSLNRIPSRI